jgi:phenylalanyl-tRNA synthetase alpha chain
MRMELHQAESAILSVLEGTMSAEDVAKKAGLPLDSVLSFSQSLAEKKLVQIEVKKSKLVALTEEGMRYASSGLPEQKVLDAAKSGLPVAKLGEEERKVGLAWAAKNGWVKVEGGRLVLKQEPKEAYFLQQALLAIEAGKPVQDEELAILERRGLVEVKVERKIMLTLSANAKSGKPAEEINQLTRELLLSGEWKSKALRKYDVSSPVEIPQVAKRHIISRLKKKISLIFAEMGFEEMEGPEVQPAFWNFDALFQPQDHPARDLADTFYVKGRSPLPKDKKLVSKVAAVHEKSWGGKWLAENAEKVVLRTHTTCLSARYLYEKCKDGKPKKFFAIGKVYRNEATDYKHLAEFYQVEGIVAWEGATFRDLLGCLKEFYLKLGFEKIRFQPSYFPYTEPSLEISVYFDKKGQWLELGGAGIFRPEVSIPLCGSYPVLAWGLSLERPLMLLNDMDDIRDFYRSSVGWIRKQRLWQ